MNKIMYKFIICTALLFGCLLPGKSQAKDKHKHKESGIEGQIVELPGPWNIRIDKRKDKLVEVIQADNTGFFEVDLKPGTYTLTPFYPAIDGPGELVGVTTTVTVIKKEITTVELRIVHGPE